MPGHRKDEGKTTWTPPPLKKKTNNERQRRYSSEISESILTKRYGHMGLGGPSLYIFIFFQYDKNLDDKIQMDEVTPSNPLPEKETF